MFVTLFPLLFLACLNPKDMERSCIFLNLCSNMESTLDIISCVIMSTSKYRNLWVHSVSTSSASRGKPQLEGFWELIYSLPIWSSVSLMVLCSSSFYISPHLPMILPMHMWDPSQILTSAMISVLSTLTTLFSFHKDSMCLSIKWVRIHWSIFS